MTTDTISYPHPVLGLSNDIDGAFSLETHIERNAGNKTIDIHISDPIIENEYFNTLIRESKAALIIKIYCSSTLKTWSIINPSKIISIPEDDLCNKIEIEPSIISLEDIKNYKDVTFNIDYGEQIFSINKYDVIGLLGKITLPIDKNYEKLGLSNIFLFEAEEDFTKPCYIELNRDKIIIHYPITKDGDHPPNALFYKSQWAAYNMFIVPALTEAFRLMGDEDKRSSIDDLEWFFVLDSILPESERDEDPYKNAQFILNKEIPILAAYTELCNS